MKILQTVQKFKTKLQRNPGLKKSQENFVKSCVTIFLENLVKSRSDHAEKLICKSVIKLKMAGKKSSENFIRNKENHVSEFFKQEYIKSQYYELEPVKNSNTFDLIFICQDGLVEAHQILFSNSSLFLRKMFIQKMAFEFSWLDTHNYRG